MKVRLVVAIACGSLALLVAGCGSGPGLAAAARLRFVHCSPDTPRLVLARDGVPLNAATAAGEPVLDPGTASLEFLANPQDAHYTGTTDAGLRVFDLLLTADTTPRLLVLMGKLGAAAGEPALEVRRYLYDNTLPAGVELGTAGTAGLRFLHAAVNVGAITFVVVSNADPDNPTETVIVDGATYGQITGLDNDISHPTEVPVEEDPVRFEARDADGEVMAVASHTCTPGEVGTVVLVNRGNRLELLKF